jgi:hypothetical protein
MGLGNFGAPPDPRYLRFAEGMQEHLKGPDSPERWRWHPRDGVWYSYPLEKFILEEVGLNPTPTSATLVWNESEMRFGPGLTYKDLELPQAFRNIDAAYDGFKANYPHAVWSARSGDWTAALQRIKGQSKPPTTETGLSANAKSRIALIRKAESDGDITHEQATELIRDIFAEYT